VRRTARFSHRFPSAITASIAALGLALPAAAQTGGFNQDGNILISDQLNNRVIETDPSGRIVWQFGSGPSDSTARSIVGVKDAQRVVGNTLMVGGATDNRVILVDQKGRIAWQYGQFGVTGAGPNQLNAPAQCIFMPSGVFLITDQGNQRVIAVDYARRIIWQYGTTGVAGAGPNQLNNPSSAELLPSGNILIADGDNDRAIEVTGNHQIVATFTAGNSAKGVAFASRLPNGHTLLTDSKHSQIIEVDQGDRVVGRYSTNLDPRSNKNPLPTRAIRLSSGNTIISDQSNHRVIVIDGNGVIVAQYGNLNQPGFGLKETGQGLNAPSDAKVIGDYTGLTPPR
jgi:hypothetical protein